MFSSWTEKVSIGVTIILFWSLVHISAGLGIECEVFVAIRNISRQIQG